MLAASLRPDRVNARAFDLDDDAAYRRWRDWKLAHRVPDAEALTVDVTDPRALGAAERDALLERIAQTNMALYRSPRADEDKDLPRALGAQLGLRRIDANWLADEDGISCIAGSARSDGRGGLIPYADRAIRWHTAGYYHPQQRRIEAMILHCVRPAAQGGATALLDHELAYIALRDADPVHVRVLMQPDAMTIPARDDAGGVARAAQTRFMMEASRHGRPPARSKHNLSKHAPRGDERGWLLRWGPDLTLADQEIDYAQPCQSRARNAGRRSGAVAD